MGDTWKRWPAILKNNLKFQFRIPLAASFGLLAIIPLFTGISALDERASAVPVELFLQLLGVLLICPVFLPEQEPCTRDTVTARYTSHFKVCILRILYSCITTAGLIAAFGFLMRANGCLVPTIYLAGAIAGAMFLGGIGLFAYALTRNLVFGYMAAIGYYALNLGLGKKLGNFYLFSALEGSMEEKLWLLAWGVVFLAAAVLVECRRR